MVLNDDTMVHIGANVEIGVPVRITIDNSEGLIQLYENVAPPADYKGKRFCFDGTTWSVNMDWRNAKLTAVKR